MLNKIETFLKIMLGLAAVLLLMAAAGRKPAASVPETTTPSVQTTAPETQPTTQPEQETEPPAPQDSDAPDQSQVRSQVEQILGSAQLEQTVSTRRTENDALNASEGTAGQWTDSHGYALAQVLEERPVNPIAAFWKLVYAGLYEKRNDTTGELSVAPFQVPKQAAKEYAYTGDGARQLMTDILTLSAEMEDGLALELALLGANLTVDPDQIFYSDTEQCYYAYFASTTDRATYILCCYFRGEQRIEDAEFQLLYLRHAAGAAEDLAIMDHNAQKQAATLMAASELLMTGSQKAGAGQIPFAYDVGSAKAQLERFDFTGTPDRGWLINYRLRIK